MSARPLLPIEIDTVKGFLDPDEGAALYNAALMVAPLGPVFEIGSYCGKSAVYLGSACRLRDQVVFTLDHHRGSEELQPGWAHHDPQTWDAEAQAIDTLPFLRRTLARAGLEGSVVPIVGASAIVSRVWSIGLSLLFIDGGHGRDSAYTDYHGWAHHVVPGGILAIHDVFPDPKDGGRPPYEIYQQALASGRFVDLDAVKSLRLLKRVG